MWQNAQLHIDQALWKKNVSYFTKKMVTCYKIKTCVCDAYQIKKTSDNTTKVTPPEVTCMGRRLYYFCLMCFYSILSCVLLMLQYYSNIEAYVMSGLGRDRAFKHFIKPSVYVWRSDYNAFPARLEAMELRRHMWPHRWWEIIYQSWYELWQWCKWPCQRRAMCFSWSSLK